MTSRSVIAGEACEWYGCIDGVDDVACQAAVQVRALFFEAGGRSHVVLGSAELSREPRCDAFKAPGKGAVLLEATLRGRNSAAVDLAITSAGDGQLARRRRKSLTMSAPAAEARASMRGSRWCCGFRSRPRA